MSVGGDDLEIFTGEYEYDPEKGAVKERIEYWWKCPKQSFLASVENIINGNDIDPKEIDVLIGAHGADHGKKKFRYSGKTILRAKGKYYIDIYSLADVKCKKDNGIVLNNTVMNQMMDGLATIAD
jgi:hypothetical protein